MKALIMAGGEGTRLRPLTSTQPKPMLPMVNRPMLAHVVSLLAAHGFDDIVVTLAFLPEAIRNFFGDGSEFGVRISYATEEAPLGTAGSVRNARDELDEPFLVISGDVVTDIDLSALVAFHEERNATATLALTARPDPLEFGIVICHEDGTVERFLEKPSWGEVFSDTVNTGIYVLDPAIFSFIPDDRASDFSGEVFPALLEAGKGVFGFRAPGYWEDVGTLGAYLRTHQEVLDGRVELEIPGFRLGEGVWLGEGAEVDPSAQIAGPSVIGDYCRIGPDVRILPGTTLGANVRVGADAVIERSVVHDNCLIGQSASLRGCVVGRSSDLRRGVRCEEGVVVGERCRIGAGALLAAGVKVYPAKTVDPGAAVNASVVWETKASRSLFGVAGVAGLANVDISPELSVRLSMAYAATLPKGSTVTTSRDTSRAARVLKRAVMVGLNASGVHVHDLEATTVPVTRFAIRNARQQGGITVRLDPEDPQSVVIRFFDDRGLDLSADAQRRVERLLSREDFRRALAGELGDLEFPARVLDSYTLALTSAVDLPALRASRFKLVVDYSFGTTSFVMPTVLAKLGADVLAINPYASTTGLLRYDRREAAARVASLVTSSGASLGVVLDPHGESLTLVDDRGQVLEPTTTALALLSLAAGAEIGPTAVLAVNAPAAAAALWEASGRHVVWSKLAPQALLEAGEEADLVVGPDGAFAFPRILPGFDAAATLVQLLAMLATSGLPLSKTVGALPAVHVRHELVPTPWERKGALMRAVVEHFADGASELLDGVKLVTAEGWVLVVPDPEEPATHLYVEERSPEALEAATALWSGRLRELVASPAAPPTARVPPG